MLKERCNFARELKRLEDQGYIALYQDETWVNKNMVPQKIWTKEGKIYQTKAVPTGQGPRLIICAAGTVEDGFISCKCEDKNSCPGDPFLVYGVNKSESMSDDYHDNMNSKIFQKWFQTLLHHLPSDKKYVIVIDKAAYHLRPTEETSPCKSNFSKAQKIEWLARRSGQDLDELKKRYEPRGMGAALNEEVERYHVEPVPVVVKLAQDAGQVVMVLPTHSPYLNPIEKGWSFLKNTLRSKNNYAPEGIQFNMSRMRKAVKEIAIDVLAAKSWAKFEKLKAIPYRRKLFEAEAELSLTKELEKLDEQMVPEYGEALQVQGDEYVPTDYEEYVQTLQMLFRFKDTEEEQASSQTIEYLVDVLHEEQRGEEGLSTESTKWTVDKFLDHISKSNAVSRLEAALGNNLAVIEQNSARNRCSGSDESRV
eukprot:Nk52_evm88s164 gene=Nk52_evmTU88s164